MEWARLSSRTLPQRRILSYFERRTYATPRRQRKRNPLIANPVRGSMLLVVLALLFAMCCSGLSLRPMMLSRMSRSVTHDAARVSPTLNSRPFLSTPVRAPPRRKTDTDRPSTPTTPVKETDKRFVIKESRSIADELEAHFKRDDWIIVLYNDQFNKREYVLKCLMEVFSWPESKAMSVMMAAHTMGACVAHECYKELAIKYTEDLIKLGLFAEARPSGTGGGGGDSGGGEGGPSPQ